MTASRSLSQTAESTADKLIGAGISLFGELGFKATTTRMIAERAGANIGSIAYYFDNKRGLYLAIARHISDRLGEKLELDTWLDESRSAQLTREQSSERLHQLGSKMVWLFARDRQAREWLLLIMREQVNPSEAFDILYDNAFFKVHSYLSDIIAQLAGLDSDSDKVLLETHFFVGQIAFLLVGRTPLLRRLGQSSEYTDEQVTLAGELIAAHVDCLWP